MFKAIVFSRSESINAARTNLRLVAAALVLLSMGCSLALPGFCASKDASIEGGQPQEVSGTNIFTPPESAPKEVPTFAPSAEGFFNGQGNRGSRLRKFAEKDGIPTFQQVKSIPSLSAEQRRNIKEIYNATRAQAVPMMEQLKGLRSKHGKEDQTEAMRDPQVRQTLIQLRTQLRDLHQQTWQKVKVMLSEQQLQEMDAMRHGELKPATFNDPMIGQSKRQVLRRTGGN